MSKQKQELSHVRPVHLPPVLTPAAISPEAAAAAMEIVAAGESENTRRSYLTAQRYWSAWFLLRYGTPLELPVSVGAVLQFVVDHAARESDGVLVWELPPEIDAELVRMGVKGQPGPMTLSTLRHRLSVLSQRHTLMNLPNPMLDGGIKKLIRDTSSAYRKRGALPCPKPPMRVNLLEALLATCDESPAGVRDRAILLFAFASGGRRRSEVAGATRDRLKAEGLNFVFNLPTSKSNPVGVEDPRNYKPITGEAAAALRSWLALCPDGEGPIFRRLYRNGEFGKAITGDGLNQIVKRRVRLAQLANPGTFETVDWEALSAHSIRSGYVSDSGRLGVPMRDAMKMTGHKTVSSFLLYDIEAQVNSPAARVFDDAKRKSGPATDPEG